VNIVPAGDLYACPTCGVPQVVYGVSLAGQQWAECLACGWQAVVKPAPRRPS
jgi:DNA-directed RNA polymerase subunit RPC12/RpoP